MSQVKHEMAIGLDQDGSHSWGGFAMCRKLSQQIWVITCTNALKFLCKHVTSALDSLRNNAFTSWEKVFIVWMPLDIWVRWSVALSLWFSDTWHVDQWRTGHGWMWQKRRFIYLYLPGIIILSQWLLLLKVATNFMHRVSINGTHPTSIVISRLESLLPVSSK